MLRGTGACLVSRARLRSQRSEALGGVASICMGSGAALGGVGVGRQRVRFMRRIFAEADFYASTVRVDYPIDIYSTHVFNARPTPRVYANASRRTAPLFLSATYMGNTLR